MPVDLMSQVDKRPHLASLFLTPNHHLPNHPQPHHLGHYLAKRSTSTPAAMSETAVFVSSNALCLKRKRDWCSSAQDSGLTEEAPVKRTKCIAGQYHLKSSAGTSTPSASSSTSSITSVILPSQDFTFQTTPRSLSTTPTTSSCRLEQRSSPLSQSITSSPSSSSQSDDVPPPPTPYDSTTPLPMTSDSEEAGPSSIPDLEDSLTACTIDSKLQPSQQTTAAQRSLKRFGFDTTLSNVQYGLSKAKPYRFTSPLSPQPEKRERTKSRRHRAKSTGLLKSTLHRNYIVSLRKRCPHLFFRPRCPPVPELDMVDDDEDEFDDDEDDELIDDFEQQQGDSQVDDIVELYSRGATPEPEITVIEEEEEETYSIAESLLSLAPPPTPTPSPLARSSKVLQPSSAHNLPTPTTTLKDNLTGRKPTHGGRVCIVNG